ncbi:MAG: hypothetical protein WC880_02580 [Candidatus Paceibacterota bacterium]
MPPVNRESWRNWPTGTRVNARVAEGRTVPGEVVNWGGSRAGLRRSLVAVLLDGVRNVDYEGRIIPDVFRARKLTERVES